MSHLGRSLQEADDGAKSLENCGPSLQSRSESAPLDVWVSQRTNTVYGRSPALLNSRIKNREIGTHNDHFQFAPSERQFATCFDLCCAKIQSQYPIDALLDTLATNS